MDDTTNKRPGDSGREPIYRNRVSVSPPNHNRSLAAGIDAEDDNPLLLYENGPVSKEIIGEDHRQLVINTEVVPYCTVCALLMTAADGTGLGGTGTFIGRRTIATAGHNLYDPKYGGCMKTVVVIPGRNRAREPFSRYSACKTDVIPAWKNRGDTHYDCGVIFLDQDPVDALGRPLGEWMTFAERPDEQISGIKVNNLGYPMDRDPTFSTMYQDSSPIEDFDAYTLSYTLGTKGGNSGGPVFQYRPASDPRQSEYMMLGIHTYGSRSENSATRINSHIFDWLSYWQGRGG